MTAMSKTIALGAILAATVLPIAGLASSAQAQPLRIPVGDLNLNTAAGAARFESRVQAAAARLCDSYAPLAGRTACVQAVAEEARDNLAAQVRQAAQRDGVQYANARR